jgi:hypothetical protein
MFLSCTPVNYQFSVGSSSTPPVTYESKLLQTHRAKTCYQVAAECRNKLLVEVVDMGVKMRIDSHWQSSDHQYIKTVKYMGERKYHCTLNHLQKLIIQQLFELNRLNLMGTGYQMCTHIIKSLNTHCKVIQNAVKAYNASALNPPGSTLNWEKASHYNFLENFELLHNTHQDICDKPWAKPLI